MCSERSHLCAFATGSRQVEGPAHVCPSWNAPRAATPWAWSFPPNTVVPCPPAARRQVLRGDMGLGPAMWPAWHLARSDIGVCWMNERRDTRKPVMAHVTFRWVVGRLFYFDASLLPAPPGCPLRGWMQGVGVWSPHCLSREEADRILWGGSMGLGVNY